MAQGGQEIVNNVTGERIVFRRTAADTGGDLLEFDDYWTRPGHRAPEHVHPRMEESWEVVSGTPRFRIGGEEIEPRVGDTVVAPAGVAHMGWNAGDVEVLVRVRMRPALRWENFMETLFHLANSGQTDNAGVPEGAALIRLLDEYANEIAPADRFL